MTAINVQKAAEILGISVRGTYSLAAPAGPIPCTRIGRRIIFEEEDIHSYKKACRCDPVERVPITSVKATPLPKTQDSQLLQLFRSMGIEPKLTHDAGKRARRKK